MKVGKMFGKTFYYFLDVKFCTKSKNAKDWKRALAIHEIRYVTRLHGFLHKSLRSRVTYPFGHMAC